MPQVKKANMVEMMEAIEKYLRLHHSVKRGPLSYVIRKAIIVQTYDTNSWYATPDDKIIAKMLHLLMKQNRLCKESMASSRKKHTIVYRVDNITNEVLDQICKDKACILMSNRTSPSKMLEGLFVLSMTGS